MSERGIYCFSVTDEVKEAFANRAKINNGFELNVLNWMGPDTPDARDRYILVRNQAFSMAYVWENAVRRELTNFEALRMLIEITSTF